MLFFDFGLFSFSVSLFVFLFFFDFWGLATFFTFFQFWFRRFRFQIGRSLALLQYAKESHFLGKTKTSLIVGMGEEFEEVIAVLKDLSRINIDIVTIGQYLRPTQRHRLIDRYVSEEEFEQYKTIGQELGIPHIESGPLVRSSYHAKDSFASV